MLLTIDDALPNVLLVELIAFCLIGTFFETRCLNIYTYLTLFVMMNSIKQSVSNI